MTQSSVTSIGNSAFEDCTGLTSVTIPNSVTSIGDSAFRYCSKLKSVAIPNSVTSIGDSAFRYCSKLKKVNISDIGAWCNIKFGNYSSNPLYYLGKLYLNDKEVTELVIPNTVTSIGDYAFYNCSELTSVIIGNSVTSIGDYTFYECSELTSVIIGNSVTSIGDYTFYECSELTSVSIGDSVTYIGKYAFEGCAGLTSVYYKGTQEDWNNIVIGSGNTYLTTAQRMYLECTKTIISDDGKQFTVTPKNIENDDLVILALYNESSLVEMQSKPYTGEAIPPFATDKSYTNARVMVWSSVESMQPICEAEIVK